MRTPRLRSFLCLGLIASAVAGCGESKPQPEVPSPLREAYSLMDQGQNAKAILLLESATRADSGNEEARVLLASAYLGEAGVDVYRIHDSFKDVLFSKSLGDSFWKAKPRSEAVPEPHEEADPKAPFEKLLDRMDVALARLQKVVNFLNRFPDVEKRNWGLLDRALENLDAITQTRDVSLYKVFIRVIYLKAYFDHEVVNDSELGSKKWACSLDLEKLRESLIWVTQNLVAASEDFHRVFPDKTSSLDGAHGELAGLLKFLEEMKPEAPVGTNTGLLATQQKLRERFHCSQETEAAEQGLGP